MTTAFLPLTVWYENNIPIPGVFITPLVPLLVHSQQNRFSETSVIYYSIIMVKNEIWQKTFPWDCLGSGSTAWWIYSEGLWGDFDKPSAGAYEVTAEQMG